jgi:putative DNA primase/helicase
MRRRFNVLPFNHPPTEPDLTLKAALAAEWGGILSWAIVGCLDWQKNGLVRPGVVREATDAYFAEQDTFALWLEEECERGKGYVDTSERLWDSWSHFASRMGEDPGNRAKSFPERLKAKGFDHVRNTAGIRGRGFKGLRVIQHDAFEEDSNDDLLG